MRNGLPRVDYDFFLLFDCDATWGRAPPGQ
jgi:hypothetical protein